jgi:hypothetical protein
LARHTRLVELACAAVGLASLTVHDLSSAPALRAVLAATRPGR